MTAKDKQRDRFNELVESDYKLIYFSEHSHSGKMKWFSSPTEAISSSVSTQFVIFKSAEAQKAHLHQKKTDSTQ